MVQACVAKTPPVTFRVNLSYPDGGVVPSSSTVVVGYRSDLVSLPGSGQGQASVNARIKNLPSNSSRTTNDLDYALRVVVSRGAGVPAGRLFTIDFDTCQGTSAPAFTQFGCTVEGCGGSTGTVPGCACEVATP